MAKNVYVGVGDATAIYTRTLTTADFEAGGYLYANGNPISDNNYCRTKDFYSVNAPNGVTVTTEYDLGTDSGFLWYDSNKTYIGKSGGDDDSIVDGTSFSAVPLSNAKYFRFNLNKTGIGSSLNNIGNVKIDVHGVAHKVKNMYVGVDGKARKVKKGYVGVNGIARLFYSGEVKFVYGTVTINTGNSFTISNLPDVPVYIFGFQPGQTYAQTYPQGFCGTIPTTSGTSFQFSTSSYPKISYGVITSLNGNNVTIKLSSSRRSFLGGTYRYVAVLAKTENGLWGYQTLAKAQSQITINVGTNKTIGRVICYATNNGLSNYGTFVYAIDDIEHFRYIVSAGAEYVEYNATSTIQSNYIYDKNTGNLVLQGSFSGGSVYYCIAFD